MTTLLLYGLATDSFPLRASLDSGPPFVATLTIVAANPNPDPEKNTVTVRGISVTLPIGPAAKDLTDDAASIGPVAPGGWTPSDPKKGHGSIEYVFTPQAGQGVIGKQGLAFVFNNIATNTRDGTCRITVEEGSGGDPTQDLFVSKFPEGWGTVSFWLAPANVPYQGSTVLHWSGPAGATYAIQFARDGRVVNVPAPGAPPLRRQDQYPAQGSPPLTLDATTVFTLNVSETISGETYAAQEQKTATVEIPAPAITFASTIVDATNPGAVELKWTSTNVSEIKIDRVGIFRGAQAASGSAKVTPSVRPPTSVVRYDATAYGLPGYAGPPALAQAEVKVMWSVKSTWFGVKPAKNDSWSLQFDRYHVLDLIDGPYVEGDYDYYSHMILAAVPGFEWAYVGDNGINTTDSEIASAVFRPGSIVREIFTSLDGYGQISMNIPATYAIKYPDGQIILCWFLGGVSDGHPGLEAKWQFTFGCTYYNPPSARLDRHGGEMA